ncbi:MAG: hypothetical protein IH986_09295 [Planctomycetes bacterium]|nr:hypothetical protein [Planctomycetota bacterium]
MVAGIAIQDHYAYVAAAYGGLQIIGLADPHAPTWIGGQDTDADYTDIAVSGDYAYLSDYAVLEAARTPL